MSGVVERERRMNVVLISNAVRIGGGNRSLLVLGEQLQRAGVEVHVAVPGEGEMMSACRTAKLPCQVLGMPQPSIRHPYQVLQGVRAWSRVFQDVSCKLVHANDISTARSCCLAARIAGVPLVCHIRFPADSQTIAWAFRRLPKPAALVFNSHALQRECGSCFEKACPQSRQYVIHNAVDIERFKSVARPEARWRVGILANLIPVKGHEEFLQMARRLTDRGIDAEYWVVGDDIHGTGFRGHLESLAGRLELGSRVVFLGHQDDIPRVLNQLDLLVCASHVEPFGRCLIEGMACELPVVATRVGGIPEVVVDGETGRLVNAGAPEELAEAVESVLGNPDIRAKYGSAGRRRVMELFTPEAHVDAIRRVYDDVLAKS